MYFVIHNNFLSPAPLRVDKISGLFECSTNVQCSIHFNEHLPSRIRLFHVCTQLVKICRLTICNMYIFHASSHKVDTHKLCCQDCVLTYHNFFVSVIIADFLSKVSTSISYCHNKIGDGIPIYITISYLLRVPTDSSFIQHHSHVLGVAS